MMGPIPWALIGLFVSFVTVMLVKEKGEEYFGDIICGVAGATIGGMFGLWMGWWRLMGAGPRDIIVTFIGAIVGVIIYHAFIIGRGRHGPPVA